MDRSLLVVGVVSLFVFSSLLVPFASVDTAEETELPPPIMDTRELWKGDFDPVDVRYSRTDISDNEGDDGLSEIHLNHISYDPKYETPVLPGELMRNNGIYLVQFDGRIFDHQRDGVEALGAEILQYTPHFSFAVRMDASTVKDIEELPYIRSVTPYYLYFKVHPDLIGLDNDVVLVNFMAWNDHSTAPIVEKVKETGGLIDWIDPLMVRAYVNGDQLLEIALDPGVWSVQEHPVWVYMNNVDSDIINARHYPDGAYNNPTDGVWSYSGGTGGSFDGLATGVNVIVSDVDTGVDGSHNNFGDATDYPNKKVWFKSYASASTWFDNNGHGTHTSGTAVGIGKHRGGSFDGQYSGMAPEAGLIGIRMDGGSAYNWMNDPLDHGANISTNSWGSNGNFNQYDQSAAGYDTMIIDSDLSATGDQHMITFFSAGNSGNNGITPPATAKNAITVGASGGTTSSAASVAGFSSRGLTNDNRIKPDIVAPGTSITSSWRGSTDFRNAQGTSMACPTAAGASALIVEYYNTTYGYTPSPALVKALMVNGAKVLSYSYPGGTQGWGRLDMAKTLIETNSRKIFAMDEDEDLALTTGSFASMPITVNSNSEEMRIHLSWLDEAASAGANPSLVNDLDAKLIDPDGNVFLGSNFMGGYTSSGTQPDRRNNIEGYRISSPKTGTWTLQVIGYNIPQGPQEWSLVVSGDISVGDTTLNFHDIGIQDIVLSSEEPVEGDLLTISAQFKNSGNLDLEDVEYIIRMDGIKIAQDNIATLEGGETVDIDVDWLAEKGTHNLKIIADPSDDLVEINEDNNTYDRAIMVHNYGLEAKLLPELQEVLPGKNTSFKLEIENKGTLSDIYDINVSGFPQEYEWDIEMPEVELEKETKATIGMDVSVPEKAIAGTEETAEIVVTSRGNSTYEDILEMSVEIQKTTGFEMELVGSSEILLEGQGMGEALVNVTNTGNDHDAVILTPTSSNPSFVVICNKTEVSLEPYSTHQVAITITPPMEARGGDFSMIGLDAETTSDLSDSVDFTVTMIEEHNMTMEVLLEDSETEQGGSLEIQTTINNLGNVDESVQLWVDVPEDWSPILDEEIPYIYAFQYKVNYISIEVPDDAPAGDVNITVGATGEFFEYEKNLTVTVDQEYEVEIEVKPSFSSVDQGDNVTIIAILGNTGNGPDTYELMVDGGPSTLRVDIDDHEIEVASGMKEEVRITFRTKDARPGSYSLRCEAVSKGNSAKSSLDTFQLRINEVEEDEKKDDNNKNNNNNNWNTDDDTPDTTLFDRYGLYMLGGLLALILIIALIALALRRRGKKKDGLPPPRDTGPDVRPEGTRESLTSLDMKDIDGPPMDSDVGDPGPTGQGMDAASTPPGPGPVGPSRPPDGMSTEGVTMAPPEGPPPSTVAGQTVVERREGDLEGPTGPGERSLESTPDGAGEGGPADPGPRAPTPEDGVGPTAGSGTGGTDLAGDPGAAPPVDQPPPTSDGAAPERTGPDRFEDTGTGQTEDHSPTEAQKGGEPEMEEGTPPEEEGTKKDSGDEIDSMITDLMGRLD